MRDPRDGRRLTEAQWRAAVDRVYEVQVEVADFARAESKLPSFHSIVLLRPELTGRDDSGSLASRVIGRSERYYLDALDSGRLGNLPASDGRDLIRAAYRDHNLEALGELLDHDRAFATSKGIAMDAAGTDGGEPSEEQKRLWGGLMPTVRDALISDYKEGSSKFARCDEPELATLLLNVLRELGRAPKAGGFVPPRHTGAPVLNIGRGRIAKSLGVPSQMVRDALLDLTSYWALRRYIETVYVREALTASAKSELRLGAHDPGDPTVSLAFDNLIESTADEESRKIWEREVRAANSLYLELARTVPIGKLYADCAEAFSREPITWEWLRLRYLAGAITRHPYWVPGLHGGLRLP
jgi:hypothetical protein